jgi:hypothetical protein
MRAIAHRPGSATTRSFVRACSTRSERSSSISWTGLKLRGFAAKLSSRGAQAKGAVTLVRTVLHTAFETGWSRAFPDLPRLVKESLKLPIASRDDELEAILSRGRGWLGTVVQLSAHAGLRMGEGAFG